MTAERWQRIEEIFHQALEREYSQRAPFLEEACAGDLALRREVESLLASAEEAKAESFLNAPALVANNRPLWSLDQLVGQTIDEKYRIDKKLGQGGMGAVYLATHLGTGRPVAVKVIALQFMANEEFVERFKREAKAAGLLRHPNVVNVTDFGFAHIGSDKLAYLVMEYLDGCNLGDMLKKRGKLPLSFVVDIVEQVCLAIDESHKQGIIHRDLKPDNIWLEPNGRGGYNVKVLDFGLAKLRETAPSGVADKPAVVGAATQPTLPFAEINSDALSVATTMEREVNLSAPTQIQITSGTGAERTEIGEEKTEVINRGATAGTIDPRTVPEWLTRVGTVLGTPLYMSPEQCAGEKLDERSDIYSLGVIVYQMLTGETPFTGDMYQLILKHSDMPPPPLREKRRDIPKAVAALVMSALAKNPVYRPATAAAFATALRANTEGEAPIMRQALDLYRKHFFPFFRISLRVYYIPLAALNLLLWMALVVDLPPSLIPFAQRGLLLFSLPIILFLNAVNTAAFTLVVEQLRVAPLSPAELRLVPAGIGQRLGALAATAIRNYLAVFLRLLKLVIPGFRAYIDNSLYAPVVMMEGMQGQAALARSQALVDRLRPVALPIQVRDFFIGTITLLAFQLTFVISYFLIDMILSVRDIAGASLLILLVFIPLMIIIFLFTVIIPIPAMFISLVHPFIAIAVAMLYSKARQAGGETFNEVPNRDFEQLELPGHPMVSYKRTIALLVILLIALTGWITIPNTALELAALFGHTKTVKALLAAGADINTKDSDGETVLMYAALNGHSDIVKTLLASGADVNTKDNNGNTALILAALNGHNDAVKALLSSGADVNLKNKGGNTALILAATNGHSDIVKALIDPGADLNAKDNIGWTALMYAALNGHSGIVKTLLATGADVNVKNIYGKTALMIAASKGRTEIVELLKAAGATE